MEYSSKEFEEKFTYEGDDLGAVWTEKETAFKVWAPTADSVHLQLFSTGTPGEENLLQKIPMIPGKQGTWSAVCPGDLRGVYYTYLVEVDGICREACDPYARTAGVNGARGMVLNLSDTDPEDWHLDQDPNRHLQPTDAVIYELHIRDLSVDPGSGIQNKGKFLGATELGTKTPGGVPTGLDHIKSLGITHLHLLPFYDYGSVDESRLHQPQFNWGYDPVNFNVPEGSYSTDPYRGEVRIKELKTMIRSLHKQGISVVMDVVYNHVYDADSFCFNKIVPGYFSRTRKDGKLSNGSGCGNDTASERSMVRKYIVDSVCYWAEEYHIDGFRFDLVGLLDVETINQIVTKVHQKHPNVLFYGEGWHLPTAVTKENTKLATQSNAKLTPNFAYFSDTIRDMLRGSVFELDGKGYVSGVAVERDLLDACFMGCPDWCPAPSQTVNYASCHDNQTLFDRLTCSLPDDDFATKVKRNLLAAAFCMLSQGIPFFQAGEELLRVKRDEAGTCVENSYNSPDAVNSIKWEDLEKATYRKTADYYRGLIAFRKAHRLLRLSTAEEVEAAVKPVKAPDFGGAAYLLEDGAEKIFVVFNPLDRWETITLPEGTWHRCIDEDNAGIQTLAEAEGQIWIAPISAAVFVQNK